MSYILVGVVFLFSILVQCEDINPWNEPYFLSANVDGISLGIYTEYQFISVQEEIPRNFNLAIINYNGSEKPKIGAFIKGNNNLLGAVVVRENDKWYIQITKRQDYENEKQRTYYFDVDIPSTESRSIMINLENIFDCSPSITYEGPCRAEELKSNFLTNCTFHVYDEDGMEGNEITFEIVGQHGEEELFKLKEISDVSSYQKDYNLFIVKELHYEERNSYNFKIIVYDINKNSGNITAILEVIDVPNRDPIWVKPFITTTLKEKTSKDLPAVQAIDGDTGINKQILYRLEYNKNEDYGKYFNIGKESGVVHVNPINRDQLQKEIFPFNICGYKYDNYSWAICDPAVIIIEDVNDNYPEIQLVPESISFLENTFLTIQFEELFVNDVDLGIHAQYNVTLSQSGQILYSEAFNVIPNAGYQKTDFSITVRKAGLLDYEDLNWQDFSIKVISQEVDILEHNKEKDLHIELINWNDELPIFDKDIYEVSLKETVGMDYVVATVKATDRDIGDKVIYEIIGIADGLAIDRDSGVIKTTTQRTFDHERQTTVIVQIRANDTLIAIPTDKIHSVYTQLIVNVIDVNDKTPELRMPRKTPNITENSPGDTLITDMIVATDPDTTANLVFRIDWDNSYATKSGQEANKSTYENCFYIEPKPETPQKVFGLLKVNPEFARTQDVDYEMYDTVYLTIIVTDTNQEVGEGSAIGILTVRIDDVNDNRPEFVGDTLNELRTVAEEAENGGIIGSIHAIDIDGPGNNIFNYSLSPDESISPLTPPDLIEIDSSTGVIRVKNGNEIDCDIPKREYLFYIITLSDGVPPNTKGNIKINVKDINNKKPQIEDFENPVKIWEKSKDGTFVGQITAYDQDRDYPHNALQFSIDFKLFPDLKNYFEINTTTGEIHVKLLGPAILDRDLGDPKHDIHVSVEDNYMGNGVVNVNKTSLTVILMDINDHAPELPDPGDFKPIIKENVKKDVFIADIVAPDIDEPDTPNSWVFYKILSIEPGRDQAPDVKNYENLFRVEGNDKKTGHIFVNEDLKGYYGTWLVKIEAHDQGEDGPSKQRMSSNKTYSFTVTPYNFHNPEIIFPKSENVLRLSYRDQKIGLPLQTVEGNELASFEAEDPDGGECGNITFEISSFDPTTSSDASYFEIHKESRQRSRLQISKAIEAKRYRLNLIAKDEASLEEGGSKSSNEIKDLKVVFIDMTSDPYFDNNIWNTEFTENVTGLDEKRLAPEAIDAKNEGITNEDEKTKVFYFINENYNPGDAQYFILDKRTRVLRLKKMLDREKIPSHTIQIITTNREDGPRGYQDKSVLLVHIKVIDVNDNPPNFDEKSYGAGITTSDYVSKLILTVHATDLDLNDTTSYLFDSNKIITNGENIENVKTKMFNLNRYTGELSLQQTLTQTMKGYFEFDVFAVDEVEHTDTAKVKIYIITEANRVKFVFYNDYETVLNNTEFLKSSFKDIYGYDMCNIDEILKGQVDSNEKEKSGLDITNVRVHFIRNNEAVDASEIQSKSNDWNLIGKLKGALSSKSLYLNDVPQQLPNNLSDVSSLKTTILIVTSILLLTICIGLSVAYFLRYKAMQRQIKAFSTPDFGFKTENFNSHEDIIDSHATTKNNIFSIDRMNPILSDEDGRKKSFEIDSQSLYSNESDFVGIQNDPIFMSNEYTNGINPKVFARRTNNLNKEKDC